MPDTPNTSNVSQPPDQPPKPPVPEEVRAEATKNLAQAAGLDVGAGGKADPNANPGDNFVKIRWKKPIGGHEKGEEWAEVRRAHNLVGSGHAELVKDEEKK